MKLSESQLNCLMWAANNFKCYRCGDKQKAKCDITEECLIIKWIADEQNKLHNDNRLRELSEQEELSIGIC